MPKASRNPELPLGFDESGRPAIQSPVAIFSKNEALQFLAERYPERKVTESTLPTLALRFCVEQFKRRTLPQTDASIIGPTVSLTGCLGMGGAERQLALTMAGLKRRKKENHTLDGISLSGPFEIAVRSLKGDPSSNFNLHITKKGKVKTHEIDHDFPSVSACKLIDTPSILQLFPHLPIDVQQGVEKLTRYFISNQTENAYLWQDGTVLHAGLAALIANVPRIIISFRGLPPSLRPHLYRPEYQDLYAAIAQVPGVTLACNNKASAHCYEDWIGLEKDSIQIVHNGAEPPACKTRKKDQGKWESLTKKHLPFPPVIGSVFNFKVDKRPSLWIEFAAAYHHMHPDSFFLLVGDGKLRDEAKTLAKKLGIKKQVAFVGSSKNVGYWLRKMDAFVLLSEFEGLPNALIEAQMAGVPVISTPAGGACDTFIDEVTGYSLSDAKNPDIGELCRKVHNVVSGSNSLLERQTISEIAINRFSIPSMLDTTTRLLAGRPLD